MAPLGNYGKWLLTLMVWREMRGVPRAWRMVIWTVLNRARIGGWWGHDVVSVITKPYQFSSMTAPGDPELRLWPSANDAQFEAIAKEVDALTEGTVAIQTDATYYFSLPLTSPPVEWGVVSLVEGGDLGSVKFYRQGLPPAPPATSTPSNTIPDPAHIE